MVIFFFRMALEPKQRHICRQSAHEYTSMRARKVTNTEHQTDCTEDRANSQNGDLCHCSRFPRDFMFNADPRATGKTKGTKSRHLTWS